MQQYINENFKLCLSSQIFFLFDMYVIKYNNNLTTEYVENIFNNLKEKKYNLEEFVNENDIYIYTQIINNLTQNLTIDEYNLMYKDINNIKINTNDVYKQIESDNTKSMIVIQIKKFDNINYIIPVMLFLDNDYLVSTNRNIELDNYFEFFKDLKGKNNLLTNFFNVN